MIKTCTNSRNEEKAMKLVSVMAHFAMLSSTTTSLKLVDNTTYSIMTKPIVISEKSYGLADVAVKQEIVYYPEACRFLTELY